MDFDEDRPSGPCTIDGIMDDALQIGVHRDLEYFFGPRADAFIQLYEDIRRRPRDRRFLRPSWNWGVLLTSFAWFIYRKQWLLGMLCLTYTIIGCFLPDDWVTTLVVFVVSLIFPIVANPLYVRRALVKIAFANGIGLHDERRMAYLVRAGGTWPLGGILAAILSIATLALYFSVEGLRLLAQYQDVLAQLSGR